METFSEVVKRIMERQEAFERDGPSVQKQLADESRSKRDAELAAFIRESEWREDGVPKSLWPVVLDPDLTLAIDTVKEWLAGPQRFLLMFGDAGTGKSVAAAWAVTQRRGWYLYASDLAVAGYYAADFWDDARLASVLALDEMGRERGDDKGWYESTLVRLLIGRCEDARKTILVANVDAAQWRARYAPAAHEALAAGQPEAEARRRDALYDRLKAHGRVLTITGPSMRIAP